MMVKFVIEIHKNSFKKYPIFVYVPNMVSYCGVGIRLDVNANTQDVQRRRSDLLELESDVVVS